jgi:arabinofuranan 3-O-arabinosyltransferase
MTSDGTAVDRSRTRLNQAAQSAVLVAFAFTQAPRWTAPDTKLDLTQAPAALLARSFTLWDPQAAAGQLQNQAYGYLFPMGPFFWLWHQLGAPPWVVQRLWWCLLLLVAFHGMRLLLARLGIGTGTSRMVAAFAYALAPRMLEGLGAISSEIWPMAVAPWVLLPLVTARPGDERVAASRSAVAFLAAGAVNAVASLALLPLPALWILTRAKGARLRLAGWWGLCVALVSAWWIVPLLLLGRYSPPFLDWIESSAVTTSGASTTEAMRGTTQWIAAISGARGPQWPAGWEILTQQSIVWFGLVLAAVGLVGVWRAGPTWSLFARSGLVVGLVLVTLGHVGPGVGPQSADLGTLLDGALAPFRNTHKFEPVVRVVLCLGLAHALPSLEGLLRRAGGRVPHLVTAVVLLAIAAQAAAPVFQGVSQRGQFLAVPGYWKQAADWLGEHRGPGRTLVLPGSTAPASYWGDPRDEALQPLASSPWIVRDAVPLGSAGATRMLNDIEARVASGYGGTELRNALLRMGISRVLLRSDLNYRATGAPAPMVVRAALTSAGARPVVAFGPELGGSINPGVAFDGGQDQPVPAIVVFDLGDDTSIAPTRAVPVADTAVVAGGSEATALLPDPQRPVVLSSDTGSLRNTGLQDSPQVLTDTLQRREANFAAVRTNYGPPLAAGEDYPVPRRAHDWLMPWLYGGDLPTHQTVKDVADGSVVTASGSLAYPDLGQVRDLTRVPDSAFDASADTMWESRGYVPAGQHVEVRWKQALTLPDHVDAVFDMLDGANIAAVTVTTDAGTARTPVSSPQPGNAGARTTVRLSVPPGRSTTFRLTIAETRPGKPTVRVRDIGVGVLPRVESWLRLPAATSGAVSGVLLQASPDRVPACVPGFHDVLHCRPDRAKVAEGELDLRRVFTLPTATTMTGAGSVVPRGASSTARLLNRPDDIRATATSTWVPGASTAPQLAIDGDPATYWAASPSATSPGLTLRFPERRVVRGLRFETDPAVTGRRITEVEIKVGGKTYQRTVDPDTVRATVRIPETEASTVAITVLESTDLALRSDGRNDPAPVVLGDVNLVGDPWPALERSDVAMPCGFGPRLQVNGTEYPTEVSGSRADLVQGHPLQLRVCGSTRLPKGESRLRVLASAEFGIRNLSLWTSDESGQSALSGQSGQSSSGAPVAASRWSATDRAIRLPDLSEPSTVQVRENANPGWAARLGGKQALPVTLDGWSQGWVVPAAGAGLLQLDFSPQTPFRVALALGLLTALLVVVLAATGRRRSPGGVGPEARLPVPVGAVAVVASLGVLAGVWGLLGVVAGWVVRRVGPVRGLLVLVALLVVWAVWGAAAPWPHPAQTNRGLMAAILTAVVLGVVLVPARRRRRRPRS